MPLAALLLYTSLVQAGTADDIVRSLGALHGLLTEQQTPWLQASILERALEGEQPHGLDRSGPEGLAWTAATYDLPVATYWKAVIDKPHQADWQNLIVSRVIEGDPWGNGTTVFQAMSLPILSNRWWVTRAHYNSQLYTRSGGLAWEDSFKDRHDETAYIHGLDSQLTEVGVPLGWTHGSWLLWALGEARTLVIYSVSSAPGGEVPAGLVAPFAASTLPHLLDLTARMAREHIASCPGHYVRPDGVALR